jgi:hypothetical protein
MYLSDNRISISKSSRDFSISCHVQANSKEAVRTKDIQNYLRNMKPISQLYLVSKLRIRGAVLHSLVRCNGLQILHKGYVYAFYKGLDSAML